MRQRTVTRLRHWRTVKDQRDDLIIAALQAGLTPTEIHALMGVSRAHIYRLLERKQQCQTMPA